MGTSSTHPRVPAWGLVLATLLALNGCKKRVFRDAVPAEAAMVAGDPMGTAMVALEHAAGDLDVSVRRQALYFLVRGHPAPGGGPWGLRGVFDPSPWVQMGAVLALAERVAEPDSRAILEALAARPSADPYVRGAAALRLTLAGHPQAALALPWQGEGKGGPGGWELAPLALAAAHAGDAAALTRLDAILREGELPIELQFFRDLGGSGLVDLAPAVAEAVDLVEEPIRLPLAAVLLELGSARGETILRDALGGGDEELRMAAIDQLIQSDHPRADALLRKAADGEGVSGAYARLGLVGRGASDLSDALSLALTEDREIRAFAVAAVGDALALADPADAARKPNRQGQALLRAALQDPEDVVRAEAIRALGQVGASTDVEQLTPLLAAEWTTLRVEAAGAMLSLGAPPGEAAQLRGTSEGSAWDAGG